MSTTPPAPVTDRPFRRRWADFWFAPGDPTTLGFIRVVTGLLILYLHLTHTLDLRGFFGEYGWYGRDYAVQERHEYPWQSAPIWDWDESNSASPQVPEAPQRRKAVMDFVRALPADAGARGRAVRFLTEVGEEGDFQRGYNLLYTAGNVYEAGPRKLDQLLLALEMGKQLYKVPQGGAVEYRPEPHPTGRPEAVFPDFLLGMPVEKRREAAEYLRALLPVLPADAPAADMVLTHLREMSPAQRKAFARFLAELPADPGERERVTAYLETWNADPRQVDRQGHPSFSVWFHVTNPTEMALIHGLTLGVMLLFTVGFCTRVTGVLTWVAAIGYIHRADQILFGMDVMMNILLVYLVVGNSGAALSVDRLIARYRAVRASLRRAGTIDEPTRAFLAEAPPSAGANLGVRLIQVHFCFIYLAAGLSKLQGTSWWSGSAFWDVMINPEFTMMRYPWFEKMTRELVGNPYFGKPFYHVTTALGVWFTWGLEISFPFLVWTRVRPLMLWLAVLLHAGIGILMGLNMFELLMLTMLLVYLPPGVIRDRLRGGPGRARLGLLFDPADPKQARAAAAVAALDVDGQVAPTPAKGRDRPALAVAGGPAVHGPAAVAALAGDLRMFWAVRWVLAVPGVSGLAARWLFPGKATAGTPRSPLAA